MHYSAKATEDMLLERACVVCKMLLSRFLTPLIESSRSSTNQKDASKPVVRHLRESDTFLIAPTDTLTAP